MKKYFLFLFITFMIMVSSILPVQASGASTVNLNVTEARTGDTVTVSGVSDSDKWIAIKAIDSSNNIVFFDEVKSNSKGVFTSTFKVPSSSEKTLTFIAGYGNNVALDSLRIKQNSSGGGGSSGKRGSSTTSTPTLDVSISVNKRIIASTTASLDRKTGRVTANLNSNKLSKALAEAEEDSNTNATVTISISDTKEANSYVTELPATVLNMTDAVRIKIETVIGTVNVPCNLLDNNEAYSGMDSVGISIGPANISEFDEELRTIIGNKPVINLKLTSGGKNLSWNNPNAPVTISIPYKPTKEELADPEYITVWYIDGKDNVVEVPSGKYDPDTGTVTFSTTHFSKYAVVYVTKTFDDLGSVPWAKKPIEVLSSKGILKGISKKEYSPKEDITRADFLYFLIRTLDIAPKVDGNFDDIGKDKYYYKEIGIAKKLGITQGTGNNKFNPDARITRQDMMVLTENTLRILNRLEAQGRTSVLDKFADKSLIADYAVDSVASVVQEGLIVGSGDNINPLGNTTRAEAAAFLYRIYNNY